MKNVMIQALRKCFRGIRTSTVVQLSKGEIQSKKIRVDFSLEDMDMSGFQKGATYGEIKESERVRAPGGAQESIQPLPVDNDWM